MTDRIAKVSATIDAPAQKVWDALVDPAAIKQYMFGTNVSSEWKEGSPITWKGEWQGRAYEDKGTIRKVDAPRTLEYTHFSPLTGEPDVPENYHTLVYALDGDEQGTKVTITQDNNGDQAEADRNSQTWGQMLEALKKHLADG